MMIEHWNEFAIHNAGLTLMAGVALITISAIFCIFWIFTLDSLRKSRTALIRTNKDLSEKITEKNLIEQKMKEYIVEVEAAHKLALESMQEAEKASNTKSDFLANMSHELRTPLNSIIGITQLLKRMPMDDESQDMFDIIKKSSENLLDIVNDILDLSKIEAQEVQLESIGFDAYDAIKQARLAANPLAEQKGLSLVQDMDKSLVQDMDKDKLYVLGDPLRFSRILNNLLSNAIRYTEEGSVKISARVTEDNAESIRLRCEVQDTGIGIPQDRQASIFEKFTQADSSTTRRFGGTGLGLTITRQLVNIMGGKVGFTSKVGVGSTFWFEIPFFTTTEIHKDKKDPTNREDSETEFVGTIPVGDVRILMAEDHEMNQIFMRKLFQNIGLRQFTMVDNGKDAVTEIQNSNYDLVLMDCHMPLMSGYDATIAIRHLSNPFHREIPIVAMTANAMPEDEEKCLSIGMDAYISKPVDIEKFMSKLSPWIDFGDNDAEKTALKNGSDAPADLSLLITNSMGDQDFVREMIALFVDQAADQIEKMKSMAPSASEKEWYEISHALKGTAGGVGAKMMRQHAADSQNLGDSGLEKRRALAALIETEYLAVKDYLIAENHYSPQ